MATHDPIPVTVVTGFLGAGKTTLINRWLGDYECGDVSVIVNEHGEIGLDSEALAARVRTLVEITGGCFCCSTQVELVRALEEIALARSTPKRIVVETSGAASPAGVVRAIAAGGENGSHVLDGVITVVDATRIGTLAEHDLAIEQVGYADVVVLSHADSCDGKTRDHASNIIAAYNAVACIVATGRGAFADAVANLESLLDGRRADFAPLRRLPTTPADHVYESLSLVVDGTVDGERFAEFMETELERFSGRLLRTKGILAIAGMAERMIVQGVADRFEVSFGEPWRDTPPTSRLVVVGFGLERELLTQAFVACAVSG